jgi:hypothetical protein
VGDVGEELGLGLVQLGETVEPFAFALTAVGLGDSVGDLAADEAEELLVGRVERQPRGDTEDDEPGRGVRARVPQRHDQGLPTDQA